MKLHKSKKKSPKKDKLDLQKIISKILEKKIKEKGKVLPEKEVKKIIKDSTQEFILKFSDETKSLLDNQIKERISEEEVIKRGFEKRLYDRWEKAIDLYEIIGIISLEIAEIQKKKISEKKEVMNFKESAIFRIHARALRIYKEILCFIKSGYADGANARIRSLYELVIISLFLSNNEEEISERYFLHETIGALKEAEIYKQNYRKLKYPPLGRKVFASLRKSKRELERRFGAEFARYDNGYGWIPRSIISNKNFAELEKHVKLSRWKPFYKLSCNSIHGSSRGLNSLGILGEEQTRILLVGGSNYGLADPIQNSSIHLLQITSCLSVLVPDMEASVFLKIMDAYSKEVGLEAVKIQEQIEKEENKIRL